MSQPRDTLLLTGVDYSGSESEGADVVLQDLDSLLTTPPVGPGSLFFAQGATVDVQLLLNAAGSDSERAALVQRVEEIVSNYATDTGFLKDFQVGFVQSGQQVSLVVEVTTVDNIKRSRRFDRGVA